MTAQPKPDMTVDAFLAWSADLPGDGAKLELIDGVVMQQQSERVIHCELKLKTANALLAAVSRARLPAALSWLSLAIVMASGNVAFGQHAQPHGTDLAACVRDALVKNCKIVRPLAEKSTEADRKVARARSEENFRTGTYIPDGTDS